jgi:site-specific recombinase XerD
MTSRLAECLRGQRHLVRDEVLYRPGGEQATRATVHKWMMQAERRAGLNPGGALHVLRHTFCSRLARSGAAAAAIQQLAGHSSYSTTSRYVHLFEGAKESAIKLLEPKKFGDILETGQQKPS